MPKSANNKLKILYLAKIFSEETDKNHGMSMSEILDRLNSLGIDSERKSIYSDIRALNEFGANIKMTREKPTKYFSDNKKFELAELKLLVDAVQSSKFITHKKSEELIKKIEELAGKYEAQSLQKNVYVANRIKTMNESIYYSVDYIQSAINKNKQISFNYFDWNPNKNRVLRHNGQTYIISPWSLIWDDENYYMIGFDSAEDKIKHYRVDKMLNLKITKLCRKGEKLFENFDMALYSNKTFSMYGGKEELVTLICKNNMSSIIIDRFGLNVYMRKNDENTFLVAVRVAVSPTFLTWLMNFGSDIKIISPENVISKFKEIALKALEQY